MSGEAPPSSRSGPDLIAERAVVFLGSVILEGWCSARTLPGFLRAGPPEAPGGEVVAMARGMRHDRPDVGRLLGPDRADPTFTAFGFTAVFDLDAAALRRLGQAAGLACFGEGGHWRAVRDGLRTVGPAGAPDPEARGIAERAIGDGLVADPLRIGLLRAHGSAATDAALHGLRMELCTVGASAVGVEFWMADAAARHVLLASQDLTWLAGPDAVMHPARPDVTLHLRRAGRGPATDRHGVLGVVPFFRGRPAAIVIGVAAAGGVVESCPLPLDGEAEPEAFLSRLLAQAPAGSLAVARALRLITGAAEAPPRPRVEAVDTRPRSGDLAVVAGITTGDILLQALLHQVATLAVAGEWVLVCADPGLAETVRAQVRARTGTMRTPVTLVTAESTATATQAAAMGIGVTDCPLIALLAPGTWLPDPTLLARVAGHLRAGGFDAIGVRTLFEDGTVAHDGAGLVQRAGEPDLLALDLPGRGLPPLPAGEEVVPVEALPGAALVVTRAALDRAGGLATAIGDPDVAAADLALRLRAAGARVGVLRSGAAVRVDASRVGPASSAALLMDRATLTDTAARLRGAAGPG